MSKIKSELPHKTKKTSNSLPTISTVEWERDAPIKQPKGMVPKATTISTYQPEPITVTRLSRKKRKLTLKGQYLQQTEVTKEALEAVTKVHEAHTQLHIPDNESYRKFKVIYEDVRDLTTLFEEGKNAYTSLTSTATNEELLSAFERQKKILDTIKTLNHKLTEIKEHYLNKHKQLIDNHHQEVNTVLETAIATLTLLNLNPTPDIKNFQKELEGYQEKVSKNNPDLKNNLSALAQQPSNKSNQYLDEITQYSSLKHKLNNINNSLVKLYQKEKENLLIPFRESLNKLQELLETHPTDESARSTFSESAEFYNNQLKNNQLSLLDLNTKVDSYIKKINEHISRIDRSSIQAIVSNDKIIREQYSQIKEDIANKLVSLRKFNLGKTVNLFSEEETNQFKQDVTSIKKTLERCQEELFKRQEDYIKLYDAKWNSTLKHEANALSEFQNQLLEDFKQNEIILNTLDTKIENLNNIYKSKKDLLISRLEERILTFKELIEFFPNSIADRQCLAKQETFLAEQKRLKEPTTDTKNTVNSFNKVKQRENLPKAGFQHIDNQEKNNSAEINEQEDKTSLHKLTYSFNKNIENLNKRIQGIRDYSLKLVETTIKEFSTNISILEKLLEKEKSKNSKFSILNTKKYKNIENLKKIAEQQLNELSKIKTNFQSAKAWSNSINHKSTLFSGNFFNFS